MDKTHLLVIFNNYVTGWIFLLVIIMFAFRLFLLHGAKTNCLNVINETPLMVIRFF